MKTLIILCALSVLLVGCIPSAPKSSESASVYVRPPCDMNSDIEALSDPQNIDDLLNLINVLPKPLDTDCLLKSLKRPLYVNATSSSVSAQPASGIENPRIFILKGNLILTIVPFGPGSKILEFSELKSTMRSIKGEISLPIYNQVSGVDAFKHIITDNQTSCSGCHSLEEKEYIKDGVQVYSSLAIKPGPENDVSLYSLELEHYSCVSINSESKRCRVLDGLLSHGEVLPTDFPSDMLTFIESLQRAGG